MLRDLVVQLVPHVHLTQVLPCTLQCADEQELEAMTRRVAQACLNSDVRVGWLGKSDMPHEMLNVACQAVRLGVPADCLRHVRRLTLQGCHLSTVLPACVQLAYPELQELQLRRCHFTHDPTCHRWRAESAMSYSSLQQLSIDSRTVPIDIRLLPSRLLPVSLPSLQRLSLYANEANEREPPLLDWIGKQIPVDQLTRVEAHAYGLQRPKLPASSLSACTTLHTLYLPAAYLTQLPELPALRDIGVYFTTLGSWDEAAVRAALARPGLTSVCTLVRLRWVRDLRGLKQLERLSGCLPPASDGDGKHVVLSMEGDVGLCAGMAMWLCPTLGMWSKVVWDGTPGFKSSGLANVSTADWLALLPVLCPAIRGAFLTFEGARITDAVMGALREQARLPGCTLRWITFVECRFHGGRVWAWERGGVALSGVCPWALVYVGPEGEARDTYLPSDEESSDSGEGEEEDDEDEESGDSDNVDGSDEDEGDDSD